ncbi:MAG: hypothetical protein WD512_11380, partial [Candidatus Paceibacterota bacterium]
MSNSKPIPVVNPTPKKSPVTCTKHITCREACAAGACLSAFLLPITKYYDGPVVALVGEETSGSYQGLFNAIGGKGDPQDNGCLIKCLIREVLEEGKIDLSDHATFEKAMRDPVTGKLRVMYVGAGKTPVFVGAFPGLSRGPINAKISLDNQDPTLSSFQKELSQVQWVQVGDGVT